VGTANNQVKQDIRSVFGGVGRSSSSYLSWLLEGTAVAIAFSLYLWLYTLWYNRPPSDIALRGVLFFWYAVLFIAIAVAVNSLVFVVSRFWAPLDRPFLRAGIPAMVFVGFQGFAHVWTHGVYFDDWNISSKYMALAIKVLQCSVVALVVAVVAVSVAVVAHRARRFPRATPFGIVALFLVILASGLVYPFTPRPSGDDLLPPPNAALLRPTVIIGIDAMTWRIVDPLIQQGLMPNFERLMAEGSWGKLEPYTPTESPEIWTTIISGERPRDHGILHHVAFQFVGMSQKMCFPHFTGLNHSFGALFDRAGLMEREPIPSTLRRVPALWDIAGFYGISSAVVNWYASYPAEAIDGIMISNILYRAYRQQVVSGAGGTHQAFDVEKFETTLWPLSFLQEIVEDGPLPEESDPFYARVTELILSRESTPGLVMAYFYQPDGVQHKHWRYLEPEKFFGDPREGLEEFGDAIYQSYIEKDRMLGRLLELIPEDALIIVCSDHGAGPLLGEAGNSGGHMNAPDGIVIMKGPHIKANHQIHDASVYDLMPTMCYLMGLPISKTWPGAVLRDAINDGCLATNPVIEVEAYPMPDQRYSVEGEGLDPELNEEIKSQLKALGYIG